MARELISFSSEVSQHAFDETVDVDDLMQELRKKGIRDLDEVDIGILESCGGFSVLLKEEDEPVSRRDLGLKPLRRSEVLTTQPLNRNDFFQNEARELWNEVAPISLNECLLSIEERLHTIDRQMGLIMERLNSRPGSL